MRIGLYRPGCTERTFRATYTRPLCRPLCPCYVPEWMLRRRYRDRISLVEFINCVMASGARLPVQIEKNPLPLREPLRALLAHICMYGTLVAFASCTSSLLSFSSLLPFFFFFFFYTLLPSPSFLSVPRTRTDSVESWSRGKLTSRRDDGVRRR